MRVLHLFRYGSRGESSPQDNLYHCLFAFSNCRHRSEPIADHAVSHTGVQRENRFRNTKVLGRCHRFPESRWHIGKLYFTVSFEQLYHFAPVGWSEAYQMINLAFMTASLQRNEAPWCHGCNVREQSNDIFNIERTLPVNGIPFKIFCNGFH